jgi:ABC-2 type transport system permease protein
VAELSLIRSYRVVLSSRLRSQLAYRANFAITTLNAAMVGVVEFIELYAILHNIGVFGGLDLGQISLVYALSTIGFATADLVFGQLDSIPTYLRLGRLEALLVRPMPLMAQLVSIDFQLRRAGRAVVGAIFLVVVLLRVPLVLSAPTVYLLIVTPIVGAAIYGALFALAGGIQFFLIDGAEFTSSFVYGGSYAGEIPGSVLLLPFRVLFTFVVPATVTAYLPGLLILGLPGPPWLPAWLGWWAPLFAVWAWVLASVAWRAGIRRFTGAGG